MLGNTNTNQAWLRDQHIYGQGTTPGSSSIYSINIYGNKIEKIE